MDNVVDAIPFEGECCFHLILHYIHHMTISCDSVVINSSPCTGENGNFHTPVCDCIFEQYAGGKSQNQIVCLFKAEGISINQSTISRIINSKCNYWAHSNHIGRPQTLTDRTARYLAHCAQKGWIGRQKTYKQLATKLLLHVFASTVHQALCRLGYKCYIACQHPFVTYN